MAKIKLFLESEKGKAVLTVIVVVLVGLGSFDLGRLSKSSSSSGIKIQYEENGFKKEASVASAFDSLEKNKIPQKIPVKATTPVAQIFFASNRGHKYYPLGCSAGKTIKQENRVFFDTRAGAEAAGYELSASCK